MALKKKLTKAEYEKLSEHIKAEYIEDGDGFRLDIDGDEDTGALKRAKDREAQLRRQFLRVCGVKVSCRDDHVGINVVAVFDYLAFYFHIHFSFR